MGSTLTCVGNQDIDGLCTGRGFPAFVAPNNEHVTYEFDFNSTPGEMKFQNCVEAPLTPNGLLLRCLEAERGTQKWRTVKDCQAPAAFMRLNLSGRFLVNIPEANIPEALPPSANSLSSQQPQERGTCIFQMCTRGRPIFESLRTRTFTHTAHTVTSGVFFALFVESFPEGVYLCPKMLLVLQGGDKVPLVEDRLGPLAPPLSFFADFSILDDGGRNLQMDLILRVLPPPTLPAGSPGLADVKVLPEGGLKTLRTCLQEYTTFNSQAPTPCVALGSTELRGMVGSSTVHLQHLVLSEAPLPGMPSPALAASSGAAGASGALSARHTSHLTTPRGTAAAAAANGAAAAVAEIAAAAAASSAPSAGAASGAAIPSPTGVAAAPADAAGGAGGAAAGGAGAAGETSLGLTAATAPPPASAALRACRETSVVLFEGAAARLAASTASPCSQGSSPASALGGESSSAAARAQQLAAQEGGGDAAGGMASKAALSSLSMRTMSASYADAFWYHIRYGVDREREHEHQARQLVDGMQTAGPRRGEFWLTKEKVDKEKVYFHCSTTLAEAITMCIVFRFSCPTDYLSLIENKAEKLLRDLFIPTNGVVLGVEEDPRHRSLYRIFVEHRNEILDDMVVCEASAADLGRIVAHQEVYDSGDTISYRLTLVYPDGAQQEAVLQLSAERLESAPDDHFAEESSLRFPIASCVSKKFLSHSNRIFVYTSMDAEPEEREEPLGSRAFEDDVFKTPSMPSRVPQPDLWGNQSDCTAEDWQSAGGGASDAEDSAGAAASAAAPSSERKAPRRMNSPVPPGRPEPPLAAGWQRPLVDSVLLVGRVEEAPFVCVPTSMP